MPPSADSRKLVVVVNFFNMRREAKRSLVSLTADYQLGVSVKDYRVIAIDNGSTDPLNATWVRSLGDNFDYSYFETISCSPVAALNRAVEHTNAELVMCCIDGARILSPGIVRYSLIATKTCAHPFIYTLAMHIGHKPQNQLLMEGYNQQKEDALIESVDWQTNGYKLFEISSLALSNSSGFFSRSITESNCFTMYRSDFLELGGFDERFSGPGGGLANLDFFKRVHADARFSPIMLLGEATFHQFHGGVATGSPISDHPWSQMSQEYTRIRSTAFAPENRQPEYYGSITPEASRFIRTGSSISVAKLQQLKEWIDQLSTARDTLLKVVPAGAPVIFVDDNLFGIEIMPERRVLPFLENAGEPWGYPADDVDAVRELERMRTEGARFIAFVSPAFWWLEHYVGFHEHLRTRFPCVLENELLVIFDLT